MSDAPADPSRRRWLGALALGSVGACLPSLAPANDFWEQPRFLDIYRPVLNKRVRAYYWHQGAVHQPGYREICLAMKDHRADQAFAMDLRLLDLLCAMQAWVRHYGYTQPIQVNSGYRTPGTNSRLEGAAKHSMHLQGKAADIVFPGLPTDYIGKLASHYAGGGVGFYYGSGFIHVDTGRRRSWVKR